MSTWNMNNSYSPGATTPGGDGSFPTTGTDATQDSIYGLSSKLAVVPVKITNEGTATVHQIPGVMASSKTYGAPDVPGVTSSASNVMQWESALALFYQMAPAERAAIEDQLYAAHLYPDAYYSKNPKMRVPGQADADSYTAWRTALEEAVRGSTYDSGQIKNAKSVQDVINDRLSLQQQAAAAGANQKNPVQFTHPDDLRAALDTAGPKTIGRRPDPSVYDNFVAGYHELESAAANQTDAGGNVTAPPSPTAAAEQYLRRTFPADAYRAGYVDAFDSFRQMVSGGSGG